MARYVILKQDGITNQPAAPTGYKYIGFEGDTFSEKTGATVSGVGGGGSVGYTEYRALITQSGADNAPTASVLNDTLGVSGSWSYVTQGVYHFTATGAFTDASKVEVYIPGAWIEGEVR